MPAAVVALSEIRVSKRSAEPLLGSVAFSDLRAVCDVQPVDRVAISVTTDASGRARVSLRLGTPGSWYMRAWSMATPSNGSSTWSAIARYLVQ